MELLTVEEGLAVVEQVLPQGHLNKVQQIVFRCSWAGQSYNEIAKTYDYDYGYIKDTGSKLWQLLTELLGEKVTKLNIKGVLLRYIKCRDVTCLVSTIENHIDWGEAIDVSIFYGRQSELITLQHWIKQDKCRLVALLGMGGIGKTALSVKLAQLVQDEFDFVIWRSLRDAPTIEELLDTLIKFFSSQQETNLPQTAGASLSRLIEYLRNSRCLIVLDNFDAVLSSGKRAGNYRLGHEDYGELLQRLSEIPHTSCLVLTSREKPAEVAAYSGEFLPVRSLQLSGLNNNDAQGILAAKGLTGSVDEIEKLIKCYAGNPLALKIAAASIIDLFNGSVASFLHKGTTVFNGVRNLLDRQFQRLSQEEKDIMYWTCINREPIQVGQLQTDIVPAVSKGNILDSLESLTWRSLIEKSRDMINHVSTNHVSTNHVSTFTQQPVVMEYMTERLVAGAVEEIKTGKIELLNKYALIKTNAKDYIRFSQIRVILEPILANLQSDLKFQSEIEKKLKNNLYNLREKFSNQPGYCGGNLINFLRQLKADLTGYDFSGLNIWQADLQGACLHDCNFSNTNISKSNFSQALANILSVDFSSDGKLLATGDANGDICLWDVGNTHTLNVETLHVTSLHGHVGWVWCIKFSPDGTLVSSGEDGTIRVWNISTGECLHVIQAYSMRCASVSFSPDGKILASGGVDGTIKIWDVKTWQCVNILNGHTKLLRAVAFSRSGLFIASGSDDHTIKLWNTKDAECLYTFTEHTDAVLSVAFSPSGRLLATGSADKTVKLWCLDTGKCWKTLQGNQLDTVVTVAFSLNGDLVTGGEASVISLWNIETGKCLQTFGGHTRRVWSVTFNPQGNILASVSRDQTVRIWDVATGKCLKTLQGYTGRVWTVAFSQDGQFLASGTDNTVRLWNLSNNKCFQTFHGHTCEVCALTFTNNEKLASSSYDQTIKIWDITNIDAHRRHKTLSTQHSSLSTLKGHIGFVFSVSCSPNGLLLASGSADSTIKLWNIETGECFKTINPQIGWVFSVTWSPNSQILAASGRDGIIKLWNTKTWECLNTLKGHESWVYSIAISPDSQTLVSGGTDLSLRLWNIKTGDSKLIPQAHTNMITNIKCSPDGNTFASCSRDQTIKIWNYTGKCLKTFAGHKHWILGIDFHPKAQILASASQDQTIRLWDINTEECKNILQAPRPYEGMNITGITGLTTAQKATLKKLGAFDL